MKLKLTKKQLIVGIIALFFLIGSTITTTVIIKNYKHKTNNNIDTTNNDNTKDNTDENTNKEDEKPEEDNFTISIDGKEVCSSIYGQCLYTPRYYITRDTTTANIVVTTNLKGYEIYPTTSYSLKSGLNNIVYGKDSNKKELSLDLYLINNTLSDNKIDINDTVNNITSVFINYDYGFSTDFDSYLIDNVMITSDNHEKFIKCAKDECKDMTSLKKYFMDKYYMSERLIEELINNATKNGYIKVEDNVIYFKGYIIGYEDSYSYNFYKTYKDNDNIYIIIDLNDNNDNNKYNSSYIVKLIKVDDKYSIDDYDYIGTRIE